MKTKKNCRQNLLLISPIFFQYYQTAQNHPKSQFLFHKKRLLRDLCLLTLAAAEVWSLGRCSLVFQVEF